MRSPAPADEIVIPHKTVLDQRRAADPRASAWVSANAGAGKTKVLVDRVLRLLLAGSPPGRVLCLTFTKAAAAEMALRVFDRLGRWVTLKEAALASELEQLEGGPPSPGQLRRARRLFARSVETPGGLKIETIHAFCERILHLVPIEAQVPARFSVLDENQSADLTADATAAVLTDAASGAFPDLRRALDVVGVEASGDALARAIGAAVKAVALSRPTGGWAGLVQGLGDELEIRSGETSAAVEQAMLEGGFSPARCRAMADRLDAGAATDRKRAAALRAAADGAAANRLKHYLCVFFGATQEPYAAKSIVTKAVEELRDELLAEQRRLAHLIDRRRAALALERTTALLTLAGAIHARVEHAKAARGALDFQDLIAKTLEVLTRRGSEWILYKLDRGVDHVLVDEAQDTNPDQWEILRRITEDFTAGAGARGEQIRTLFAVGDPKQSIFGFQGAAPREFEANRGLWERKVTQATLAFHDVRLDLSFRSGTAILSAVDATFAIDAHFRGLSYDPGLRRTAHTSARPRAPGLVELWPTETAPDEAEPDAWTQPVDEAGETSPAVAVAERIARAVKHWTTQGDEQGRRWAASDVLILVRKRGPAFEAVIRALRRAGVAVAGADRIEIGEHIAVQDLVAAGRAALLPEDDLTLAVALKSPLVGLDDDDLLRIAGSRPPQESLAAALRRHAASGDAGAARGGEAVAAWRRLAGRHGPFGFYATLLGPMDGRAKLVARLGGEAGDAVDAFLSAAHGFERTDTPSLITFLARFEQGSHPIKRELDAKRDEVRVMTVHGAKGLEAPVVIVIDGCEVSGQHPMPDPPLIPIERAGGAAPTLVWSCAKADDCARVAQAREAMHAKDLEEHNRLLYVAMTRARDRLVIAPYAGKREPREAAWCEMVRRGLAARVGALALTEAPYGPTMIWRDRDPAPGEAAAPANPAPEATEAPEWLTAPVAPAEAPPARLSPSDALGAETLSSDAAARARRRGTLTHALLQRLPAVPALQREAAARAYLAAEARSLDQATRDAIMAEVLGVIDHPALAPLFGPGSRAEVGVSGQVRVGSRTLPVPGRIDRLCVLPDEILIADFKTGRPPPAGQPAPEAYVAQLALYRALLWEIDPERRVRALLVWTQDARVESLPDAALDAALGSLKAA